jgi:hypothetical protein
VFGNRSEQRVVVFAYLILKGTHVLGACFRGDFSRSAFFVSVFVLNKKARKKSEIEKEKRGKFMRVKSPF